MLSLHYLEQTALFSIPCMQLQYLVNEITKVSSKLLDRIFAPSHRTTLYSNKLLSMMKQTFMLFCFFVQLLSFNQKKVWIKYNCYFMFSFKYDELKDANSKNKNRSFSLCTSFYFPSFQAIKIWSFFLQ